MRWSGSWWGFSLAVAFAATGCQKAGSPEAVADAFAEAYFRRADQEKAKEFTAFGATEMLERELRDVRQIRGNGYTPSEGGGDVSVHRGEPTRRDRRIRFPFELTVRANGSPDTKRTADVELAEVQGAWKVVRVGFAKP